MSKSTRLKFYIILPVLILILGLVIYNNYSLYTPDKKCDDFTLTSSPLDLDKIKGIIPLGALSPPSHTFPTDHIYFVLPEIPGTDITETVNLYSPGDLWVVSVRASEQLIAGTIDYAMLAKVRLLF